MAGSEKEKELIEITGTVEQIVYKNSENAYTVIDIFDERGELLTAVGVMPYVNEGDTVMLAGKWKNHQTFGKQFEVEYFDRALPSDETDILRYLASSAVKGIGPKMAQKIVGRYGSESFDIIENHPEWLADIPGISLKKAQEISENFKQQFGVRNIMLLAKGELSAAMSLKIFKHFKSGASDIIRENPYILCEQISGIGFEKCDTLAHLLGVSNDSIYRIKSGIIYLLNYNADRNGHTFLPREKLVQSATALLGVNADQVSQALEELVYEKKAVAVNIEDMLAVYNSRYYNAEKYCAEKLILLDRVCAGFDSYDKRMFIDRIELENGMTYAALQRKAIEDAIENGVMILTGGPGTGKTTVIRALIRIFENMGMSVSLAAPTGRAAKRMSDSTGSEAKTIHRLLEMEHRDDDELSFRRNENDQLDSDVVIIDEASMLGISLLESLLKAIKPGARLLLIGDSSQLPSVGAGNVLADLISSERFCTVCLTEIFRQAEQSLIVTNAHAINKGEYPDLTARDRDFFFMARQSDAHTADTVAQLYAERLPKTYGAKAAQGIQVVSPTRNGISGTENLNKLLQERINPPHPAKNERKSHGVIFREGDRVMQIKNNYEIEWEKDEKSGLGIFNGDIGVIESINTIDETMIINFDNRITVYDFSMLDELEHSYAITVHKSQGSEYP
ncbi:MAG: ATP-dependent RecD-like DNA helicase, partial [Clostridia bacterium]|nr:ATP-dependent RecD-like DNA helicase [Clostridia bacterium]